jgi:hypothetical protein
MTPWEYGWIAASDRKKKFKWCRYGQSVEEFSRSDYPRRLSELGEEGWELVAVDRGFLYFKRPSPLA